GGSIVSRLTNDTEAIVEMFIGVFATFLMAFFLIASRYGMMFVLDVRLAFMALIFMPLIFLIMLIYRKYSAIFFSHARQLLSDLNAKLSESIEGMKIIQVFNQEKRLQEEFRYINDEQYEYNMTTDRLDGLLLRPSISMIKILS